ncbi:hypothetical protein COLO4_13981 [Corchorus olitorius]|uniref:BSD domain-containing protein n=1 Tax=Corchorus olitorius TaxID=93759 RepID=A0A1R3JU76_9ROSI|nr:hypothetical protein COLO4_13981 [Corchorus olitorius]
MDFFKSVFADDVESEPTDQPTDPNPNPESTAAWSFGGIMRTIAVKSESVIEFYRKDLEELGSGLKKETEIIRSVASRAVNDSLEIGATVAQEKLESVGQAIDDIGSSVWKSTAQIISNDGEKCLKNDEEKAGSSEDSDVSVVSSHVSMPEEEGWDEIEEIPSSDENKGEHVGNANKVDLHKRLSVAEEDEDLSWDIEDDEDDQPVKA